TTKEGVRLLTTYNVTNGSSQTIKLGDDPLTAVTWLSNDYILLSETKTGLRSICPDKEKNTLASAQAARAYSMQAAGSFDMSTGEMADTLGGLIREMALSTPRCVDYGLRSHDAG